MKRPKEEDFKYYQEGVVFKTVNVIAYAKAQDKYTDQLEAEYKELESDNEYIKKQNVDVHNEIKPLIKSLRAIESLTSDERLPVMKVLHEIAHKALSIHSVSKCDHNEKDIILNDDGFYECGKCGKYGGDC